MAPGTRPALALRGDGKGRPSGAADRRDSSLVRPVGHRQLHEGHPPLGFRSQALRSYDGLTASGDGTDAGEVGGSDGRGARCPGPAAASDSLDRLAAHGGRDGRGGPLPCRAPARNLRRPGSRLRQSEGALRPGRGGAAPPPRPAAPAAPDVGATAKPSADDGGPAAHRPWRRRGVPAGATGNPCNPRRRARRPEGDHPAGHGERVRSSELRARPAGRTVPARRHAQPGPQARGAVGPSRREPASASGTHRARYRRRSRQPSSDGRGARGPAISDPGAEPCQPS